ncbi:MAG: hypothetical protein IKN54_05515 [Lachnospiraceae bacterium]|nr:hypothetical protein [Lachnospiraceae bacterium]
MMGLLLIRDKIKNFYGQYEFLTMAAIKFILIITGLFIIKNNIGYMESIEKTYIIVAISLLCAFIPMSLVVLVLAVIILANIYVLSMQLALTVLGILLVMFILYFRFSPKEGLLLIITPMLFFLKIPYVIPLVVGLIGTPFSCVAVAFGTMAYYMIYLISSNAATIRNIKSDSFTTQIEFFMNLLVENKAMIISIVIFTVVIVVVYVIKRMSINNSWATAVGAGGVLELIMFIATYSMAKTGTDLIFIVIGWVFSLALAFILQFFIFSVDYSRTEHTQFEDDEYYYYVKAVPKITVIAPEMNIKRINAQRNKIKTKNNKK